MNYYYNQEQQFVIESYDKVKTFSSFLPGIAGKKGIPIWAFYVNRGQGISGFGVKNKDNPIMEFFPANSAYRYNHLIGFRSFVKINGSYLYEPFAANINSDDIVRTMKIKASEFVIEETNKAVGIKYIVTYFCMPNENYGALVRMVDVENISDQQLEIQVVDGLAAILPSGISNSAFKEEGNLLRSWMEVYHIENGIPYYKIRASLSDEAEVEKIEKGHFYLSFSNDHQLLETIVDGEIIFGENTSLSWPDRFHKSDIEKMLKEKQVTANKVPCGFSLAKKILRSNETLAIRTIIGHTPDIKLIYQKQEMMTSKKYIDKKRKEAEKIINQLTNRIKTQTGSPVFDAYVRQNFLDNLLRGGYPTIFQGDGKQQVYYLYSRKHGDLERDYNFFEVADEYYSQGNGHFRDVNQNRRNDIYIEPRIYFYNVKTFMSLIQIDGYNPLEIKGATFKIRNKECIEYVLKKHGVVDQKELRQILLDRFTPGKIMNYIENKGIVLESSEDFLIDLLTISEQNIEASYVKGYWSDHFTYNMDLVESFLDVYPDREKSFLFDYKCYRFFDSPVRVLPRHQKYVLTKEGKVRQYGAVIIDSEKINQLGIEVDGANWLRVQNGKGKIYETNLMVKLLTLALNKYMLLDPTGMGVEMEANKPGWNDAMNGLPGLFGSGTSETYELKRILMFIGKKIKVYEDQELLLPIEIYNAIEEVVKCTEKWMNNMLDDYNYWNRVSMIREKLREDTRFGILGSEVKVKLGSLKEMIELFSKKVDLGLNKAKNYGKGLVPTYFVHEAINYEKIRDDMGKAVVGHYGLINVRVKAFKPKALPHFLEAPARALKVIDNIDDAREIYQKVKATDLYDKKLKMYKTSVKLDGQSHEIGRIRAFTPGWQERESIFLHMTYKYLLALLKAGLYVEFFEEIKSNMVCFMDAQQYGRSILENSSFIASSANPNPKLHGQGFVARLSGTTAEFISIWHQMMVGKGGYKMIDGKLVLSFQPILPGWLFDKNSKVTFNYLGYTKVTYINVKKKNTYGDDAVKPSRIIIDNDIVIKGDTITQSIAIQIRNEKYKCIEIILE